MPASVDVNDFMDNQRISWFQIKVVLACLIIQYFDGFDWLVIAYAGPSLTSEWQIGRENLGAVFGAGVFGVAIGTLAIGPLADVIGRRWLTIGAVAFFGFWSLITAFATAPWQLMPLRFIAGLGLGAAIPSCIVLVTEYAPRRRRATMVMAAACGFGIGSATSGLIASHVIPLLGWRALFIIGGGVPLLMVIGLIFWLPESIRFLVVKQGNSPLLVHILQKINSRAILPSDVIFVLADEQTKVRGVSHLFQGENARITPVIWGMFFFQLLVLNFLNSWLPSISHSAGFALSQALQVATSYQFGGILGVIGLGILADRFGFYAVLGTAFVSGAVVVALMPFALSSAAVAVAVFSVAGFFVIGNGQLLNAFAASIYPTPVRSTGMSWALGVGRFGSTAGPLLGGVLIGLPLALPAVFLVIGTTPIAVAFAALLVVRYLRGGTNLSPAGAVAKDAG